MQNNARIFAYATWVAMISLAIILFSSSFLVYIDDPGWIGLAALLVFGLIYLNFTYISVKRYIRKIVPETKLHYLLALLIFLPPAVWLILTSDQLESTRILLISVFALSCSLGAIYGYRSGKRQQLEHAERFRKQQEES